MFMCKRKRDEDMIIVQGIMYSKLFVQLFEMTGSLYIIPLITCLLTK